MIAFLDANVFVYAALDGPERGLCAAIIEAVAAGDLDAASSPSVLEEVWHLEHSGRLGLPEGTARRCHAVVAPLLAVGDEAFAHALSIDAPGLGTNDRLHAGTCIAHGIATIVTADQGFDGIDGLARVDPLPPGALSALGIA